MSCRRKCCGTCSAMLKAALLPENATAGDAPGRTGERAGVLSAVRGSRRSEMLGRLAEQDQRLGGNVGYITKPEASPFQYRLSHRHCWRQSIHAEKTRTVSLRKILRSYSRSVTVAT